ncbi:MAG: hypothetical protein KC912_20810 [Proteobacteria bacterium]|nr:hypothetical protein [Pseudomonadota bacterium]
MRAHPRDSPAAGRHFSACAHGDTVLDANVSAPLSAGNLGSEDPPPYEPSGCGCSNTSGFGSLGLMLVPLVALRRKRRVTGA